MISEHIFSGVPKDGFVIFCLALAYFSSWRPMLASHREFLDKQLLPLVLTPLPPKYFKTRHASDSKSINSINSFNSHSDPMK
jgi:hypothetical protein